LAGFFVLLFWVYWGIIWGYEKGLKK